MKATVFARTEDFERFRNRLGLISINPSSSVNYVDPEKVALAERLKKFAQHDVLEMQRVSR